MLDTHVNNIEYWEEEGYVVVEEIDRERVIMARPGKVCLRELRGGHKCLMDKDHRGRCTSVVFVCDVCSDTRRGQPHGSNGEVQWCFLCDVEWNATKGRTYA